ncbi:MAG: hypothetical protein IKK08_11025 [Clostridia bacterium]|nr:hypothetical protein [Clostridia bacterium]
MFRWFRLLGQQHLGFWALGLALFMIQEIPYLMMPLVRMEANPIMTMPESSLVLERCEKLLGSLCIALMLFVVHRDAVFFSVKPGREALFFGLAMGVLLLNFFGWALYFSGCQTLFVMLTFIVAMPPLFYVFIGLWRANTPLTVCGCVFLAVHFVHVLGNLKMTV